MTWKQTTVNWFGVFEKDLDGKNFSRLLCVLINQEILMVQNIEKASFCEIRIQLHGKQIPSLNPNLRN